MKKVSIVLVIVGVLLIIFGNVFYGHHPNADDTGGSAEVITFGGHWSVKIPAFIGGVLFVLGLIFYYAAGYRAERHKVQH